MKQQFSIFIIAIAITTSMIACKGKIQEKAAEEKEQQETGEAIKAPLPSWNEGKSKQAIIDFVSNATDKNSQRFIPVEDRIAVFDNDGTLCLNILSIFSSCLRWTRCMLWLRCILNGRKKSPFILSWPAT